MIYYADDLIKRWVNKMNGAEPEAEPHPSATALGVMVDGRVCAGVIYDAYNGQNVVCTIAARAASGWANRRVLTHLFAYAFRTMRVRRITCTIPETNDLSRKLCVQMGFVEEARLRSAAADGSDVIMLAMFKEDCRWIAHDGQSPETAPTA